MFFKQINITIFVNLIILLLIKNLIILSRGVCYYIYILKNVNIFYIFESIIIFINLIILIK